MLLLNSIGLQVSTSDLVTIESLTANPVSQRDLSRKLENQMFRSLLGASSIANKARLLAVSAFHAASWISVVPSVSLGLHLDPSEFKVAIKWWLGMDTSRGFLCSLCPEVVLDPLGHLGVSCKRGGDAVIWHNKLRDVCAEACRHAHFPVRIAMGSGLPPDHNHLSADMLVGGWERGMPAAFDITVTSPLCPAFLGEASQVAGAAALAAETRKHIAYDRVGLGMCSHCCGDIWQLGSRGKADILMIGISSGY